MSRLAIVRLGVDVPYEQAWDLQRQVHARRVTDAISDTCLMLEHAPVYTAGKRTAPSDRPQDGTPVVDVDRGGKITWHGPGQLTGYPIVKLAPPLDVVAFIRLLEEALIRVCWNFGLETATVEGRTGVWVPASRGLPDRKVGAIGLRVARGVTMHGFALNCCSDLNWFNRIVPCGIPDAGVSSLSVETGRLITVDDVIPQVEKRLAEALGADAFDLHEEDLVASHLR
ncbi:lipoyl(octanoyl) transferase LipB [Rhizohabitans arisaemae]|uniref:lipoyl(octanoyl) transferase LipB n=1 Tax=Rhizohabitans arisaemae TaxID=2720610 RepID=UPI0024B1085F|nr:lipoyl(octanoyl) transferase LipB [Rhizohabitans arisaemae]